MVTEALKRIGAGALDLVYPPRCALCRRHGAFLCAACLDALPRAEGRRCDACWLPLRGFSCRGCRAHRLWLQRLRSVWRYEEDARRLVRAYKFHGLSVLGQPLGAQLAHAYGEYGLEADLVAAVPLTPARQRERGYNQASMLAREVGRLAGLPLSESLRRRRGGPPQASSASAEQRRSNVMDAFEVADASEVDARRVLLIDDVATTGATLSACAAALLDAGAIEVNALTLARED